MIPYRTVPPSSESSSEAVFQTSDSMIGDAPTVVLAVGPYVLCMPNELDASLTRVLAAFVLDGFPEPVIVLDGAGDVRALNRAARADRYRTVLEFFEASRRGERVVFLEAVRRSGHASIELPRTALPRASGPFVLDGFAVEQSVVVTVHDQGERRDLEDELRQLRRIESLGLMTASVIHDFNNLMTPMLALSSSLASELRASSSSLELAADIESIASRTASLFRDMVMLAKPRRHSPEAVGVRDVVSAMRPLLQCVAGERVELLLRVEDNASRVFVERSRLEHTLLNLVANARHAMPEGGNITIAASRESMSGKDDTAGTVLLVVSDTGMGMSEYVRAHACDDFFTTRDKNGGTGLGLASVKRFVTENGGTIGIQSEPGRGTTITIRLPEAEG